MIFCVIYRNLEKKKTEKSLVNINTEPAFFCLFGYASEGRIFSVLFPLNS